jgi:hypothetical protein
VADDRTTVNTDINATDMMWAFFEEQSR